jgi:LysM repeat protein
MVSRWGRILPILLLALAACTRQADGPFEPVSGEDTTAVAEVPTTDFMVTEETAFTPEDITEEVIETDLPPVIETEVEAEEPVQEDEPIIFTLAPTETFEIIEVLTEEPELVEEETPEFITPSSSSGLMEPGAATEEPAFNTDEIILEETSEGGDTGDGTTVQDEDPFEGVDEDCIYVVQRGDTLFRIAVAQNTTIDEIRAVNESIADTDTIFPGDELLIPNCNEEGGADEPVVENEPTDAVPTAPAGTVSHTVRSGESLFVIAQRYGVTIQDIVNANELADPNRLSVGQVLIIPQGE